MLGLVVQGIVRDLSIFCLLMSWADYGEIA
jgi:hypothetical protein